MILLIHDLSDADFRSIVPERPIEWHVVSQTQSSHICIGCMDCWFQSHSECPLRDNLGEMADLLAHSDEIYVISRCVYGSVSPFIKMVFDRMIASLRPIAELRGNDTRFRSWNRHPELLKAHFYGPADEEDQKTAQDFLHAFARFYHIGEAESAFFADPASAVGGLL